MVLINNFGMPVFQLRQGVQQRCSLFPALFIIATAGLKAYVRSLQVGTKFWQMDMFADDLTAYVGSKQDLIQWHQCLIAWQQVSGLEWSKDKSVLWSLQQWKSQSPFKWVTTERVLVVFLYCTDQKRDKVAQDYIVKLKAKVTAWKAC